MVDLEKVKVPVYTTSAAHWISQPIEPPRFQVVKISPGIPGNLALFSKISDPWLKRVKFQASFFEILEKFEDFCFEFSKGYELRGHSPVAAAKHRRHWVVATQLRLIYCPRIRSGSGHGACRRRLPGG